MKHIISAIIVAGSLLLVDAMPAAAHEVMRNAYDQPGAYRSGERRSKNTPSWLKHNDSFKGWYKRSPLKNNRYVSWSELYQIFWWERSYAARRYQSSKAYYDYHSSDWYQRNRGSNAYADSWSRYSSNRDKNRDRKRSKHH
jgi:hypothetical protein